MMYQIALLLSISYSVIVFDFSSNSSENEWRIQDDVVMGGRSNGNFKINEDGHGQFYGEVSLENNGGFSSVRHRTRVENVSSASMIKIRLKGDGKKYQFRVKQSSGVYYSYITYFQTTGEWETVEIPLNEMYPSFRGRRLYGSNFDHSTIAEITFLIGNKRAEQFSLLLDKIEIVQ